MNIKEMIVTIVISILVAGVLLSPAACTMNRHNKVANILIKTNRNGLEIKCAIEAEVDRPCLAYKQ